MNCDECRAMMDARHDGRLDADESADAAAHLADCADCRAGMQSLARADDIVRMAASGMGKSWAAFRGGLMARVAAEADREVAGAGRRAAAADAGSGSPRRRSRRRRPWRSASPG